MNETIRSKLINGNRHYKTDARSFIDGYDNVMLHGAPEIVLHNEDELREFFGKLK